MRDRAVWSACLAHNQEVGGSNPSPATKIGKFKNDLPIIYLTRDLMALAELWSSSRFASVGTNNSSLTGRHTEDTAAQLSMPKIITFSSIHEKDHSKFPDVVIRPKTNLVDLPRPQLSLRMGFGQ